jgi:hypothetical protein
MTLKFIKLELVISKYKFKNWSVKLYLSKILFLYFRERSVHIKWYTAVQEGRETKVGGLRKSKW